MNQIPQLLFITIFLLALSCTATTSEKKRMQAERRWSQVRAGVKLGLAGQQCAAGHFEECIRTAREAIALDAARVDAYVLLARAQLELSRPASAQQALEAARKAGLVSADLLYTEGVLLEQRDEVEAALAKYSEALERNSAHVDSLVAQAECLVALGRIQEARKLLAEQAEPFDDEETLALLTAHVAALMGDYEEAARRFREVTAASERVGPSDGDPRGQLEAMPEPRTPALELGVSLVRSHRCEEALPLLRTLLANPEPGSDGGTLRRGLAECYLELDDAGAARDILIAYTADHPEDASAQLLLTKAALALDDLTTAIPAMDAAQRAASSHSEVWFVRAVLEWRLGDYPAAKEAVEAALRLNSADSDARCLLGEILLAVEQPEPAVRQFQLALHADPDSPWAKRRLKRLAERTTSTAGETLPLQER